MALAPISPSWRSEREERSKNPFRSAAGIKSRKYQNIKGNINGLKLKSKNQIFVNHRRDIDY